MVWLGNEFDFLAGAILNIYKPVGKSSFWIVKQIRNIVKAKVGHAGTLDPFADGVLIVCTGKATKQVASFVDLPKVYEGIITLGIETDTDDVTGIIRNQKEVPDLSLKEIIEVCNNFTGEILQVPPMFSAKKINGRRLYKYARAGVEVERKPSKVTIENFDIITYNNNQIEFNIKCSKGTYIRALARDIGNAIGCGAHLKSLSRKAIGDFKIEDSIEIQRFREMFEKIL